MAHRMVCEWQILKRGEGDVHLIELAVELDDDLARAVVMDDLELAYVYWSLDMRATSVNIW